MAEPSTRERTSIDAPPMTVAIAGASGFLGSALAARLEREGHAVRRIGRGTAGDERRGRFTWDPATGRLDASVLDGAGVVFNLSGANIGERWTRDQKRAIVESRVRGTELLARAMAGLRAPPGVFVAMSAIGFYGNRGDEPVDESTPPGEGFLVDVVRRWEAAARPASDAGIRVVHPRVAPVLSPRGGMLSRLLPIFSLGGGGKIGKGSQWLSWVGLEDALRALMFVARTDSLSGAVNVTSPNPVTNAQFTHTFGHVLHRPSIATVPEFALKLMYGEMANETLLTSQRVLPGRLLAAGFSFAYPELEAALRHELAAAATT